MYVRVHKGHPSNASSFSALTDDEEDRFAFCSTVSSFEKNFGNLDVAMENDALHLLQGIGFEDHYIREKLERGFVFSMLVFDCEVAYRADWDGLRNLLEDNYPEIKEMGWQNFWEHDDIRKSLTEEDAEAFHQIRSKGKTCDEYLDLKRLQKYEGEKTAKLFRKFLFFELGIRNLFVGDGYTYNEVTKKRGVEEFLVPNMKRDSIKNFKSKRLLIKK